MYSRRGWGVVPLAAALLVGALFSASAQGGDRGPTIARSASAPISSARTFHAPQDVTHLAVHWRRARAARVRLALSLDGRHFRRARPVELDAFAEARPGRETYGAIIVAHRVRAVRVFTDRPLRPLTVLWLDDRGQPVQSLAGGGSRVATTEPTSARASAGYPQPKVIPRVDWGANESYRFDSSGQESWPPAFYPVQKLIVHHTATQNNDPDPAATVRSIYYYHAVTQGWGDIGYNFLVDEAGRVYEGRHTFDYPSGSSPTEENSLGYGVTAAHAQGYNSGTVGIALLGTLTNQDATSAARGALERVLAWESDHHGIDPQGSALYTNPVNGTQANFANIAGHRNVAATECPGGVFYATLPTIRSDVAAMIGGAPAQIAPTVITGATSSVTASSTTVSGTVNPNGQQTSYYFQYGRSTAYGGTTTSTSAGAGSSALPVSAKLSGLQRRTTYHYRLVATNPSGISYGSDRTFKTARR